MWKKLIFCSLFLVSVFGYFSLRSSNNKSGSELLGVYLDGVYGENIPGKSDGYVVDKVECDNDATGVWDYDKWGLLVNNMSKKSKCNVFFKKGIKLADTIISVDTSGKCPTVNDDGTVNVTGAESENSLLCSAPDNYGNSYYFRGNVQNNYVYFANFYWRIIRINGDGSIRMIYDGTTAHVNGEASEDRIIGTSPFNEKYDDNAYVGYMYGTAGSSSYEETHANINDSTIKKYVDNWYEINLLNVNEYFSDNDFYNERSFSPDETKIKVGYSNIPTAYHWQNSYFVIVENNVWSFNPNSKFLTVKKSNKNDIFNIKNCNLKYPIGLISVDELVLAGGEIGINNKFYMYSGQSYWTMSPYMFFEGMARLRIMSSYGNLWMDAAVNDILGVKPVINLKAGSLTIGDGSISNPYKIF